MPRKTASRTGTPRTRNTRTEWWDATAEHPAVEIVRSSRRTKTVSGAMNPDGSLRLLVPASSTRHDIEEYLQQLAPRIMARAQQQGQRKRKFSSDAYLVERAQYLIDTYLPEVSLPDEIRWVTNQKTRWGSATPATSRIRISHMIQGAPEYVVDYVLHHELCHFMHLDHGPQFKALEKRYPHLEKAQGFLDGVSFQHRQES
ncbi:YgjP-like metallopeptidase domain-containing protein [Rothia terrae]|uniref:M48 family metallopeptidase n=1 Tax=Rothia terrae TaxID=396015 RepID=UPI0028810909|nr:YgjP-like metallopeptidase domain-containing protein [Rothia terrae]MDT0189153.1 DUF45 domain-containing protein [Rothia terrae]